MNSPVNFLSGAAPAQASLFGKKPMAPMKMAFKKKVVKKKSKKITPAQAKMAIAAMKPKKSAKTAMDYEEGDYR